MQGAGKPALPVQLTETHSALMRYGVGTSSANDIVNAICLDVPTLRGHGSIHLQREDYLRIKETIREEKITRLYGTIPGGKIIFYFFIGFYTL